ncbi:unnamed protein product [Caenorhabditis angaria]|uniref:Uncharacterized protein n=1 Tax=Caenorhabditis angaria TaxID=860376 RepID=A0A9P1MXE9_9PELO|nr:unnamed protein product [Caenorhabditis angaria]
MESRGSPPYDKFDAQTGATCQTAADRNAKRIVAEQLLGGRGRGETQDDVSYSTPPPTVTHTICENTTRF